MTPSSVLSTSKDFHRGYELCFGNGLPANNGVKNAIVPAIVCLAFSIELAFKAILVGVAIPSEGHNFYELFNKLPNEIKTEIETVFIGDDENFLNRLKKVSKTFIEWRYIFEAAGTHSINLDFLIRLHEVTTRIGERYVSEQRAKILTKS